MNKGFKRIKNTIKYLLGTSAALLAGIANSAGLLTPIGQTQPLEILSQQVDVKIQDGFAMTTVEQVFDNPGNMAIDAQYRFPVPQKAAVGQFTYWVHGKPIHGEVLEKQKAQQVYETEKQAGRKVALTEQQDYKHFDIKVAQIQPGESARIKLVYFQPLEVDHGIGRYVYPLESGGTDEVEKAFWRQKSSVQQQFDFNLTLNSGFAVSAVRLPNYPQASLQQQTSQQWTASLSNSPNNSSISSSNNSANNPFAQTPSNGTSQNTVEEKNPSVPQNPVFNLNKDIVFYWRLQEGTPGAVDVVAYKPDANSTGTLMVTLTPADDLQTITRGTDWTLLLDLSGSMSGKYQTLIEGVKKGLEKFNVNDRVRIILFNNTTQDLSRGFIQATPENLNRLMAKLDQTQPNGGTNLMAGIKESLRGLDADRTSAIWLVTDGVANIGETQQKDFLKILDKKDIRLFTFIMGNGANRPLLQAMSKASNGFALSVSNSDDIVGQLEKAASKVSHEALHDVQVSFNGVSVKDLQPSTIGSLYRGQQLQLFAHYWKGGSGELVVTAKRSGQKIEYKIPVQLPETNTDFPELERLWAYAQILDLMDEQMAYGENADRKDAVIDLAKQYSLVTDYTSMLVLEEAQFKHYGINRNNQQRIDKEEKARKQRKTKAINNQGGNHNQAQNHPTFSQPRASHGGSGAFNYGWIIGLGLILFMRRGSKNLRKLMS